MNFANHFGRPEGSFPCFPPPFMPWNLPPFDLLPPFPNFLPPPPLQIPSEFRLPNPNPYYIQQQNNYYGSNFNHYDPNQCTNPFFEKLRTAPQLQSARASKQPHPNDEASFRDIEVIQISDDEPAGKRGGQRAVKKKAISKQKRICTELKRLNNKKYPRSFDENYSDIERELKDIVEKLESQPRRITRVSGRIPKEIKDFNASKYQRHLLRKNIKKETPEDAEDLQETVRDDLLFSRTWFQMKIPELVNAEVLQFWRRDLKEGLILRKFIIEQSN